MNFLIKRIKYTKLGTVYNTSKNVTLREDAYPTTFPTFPSHPVDSHQQRRQADPPSPQRQKSSHLKAN